MTTVVIMPGGFHPFHAGHLALYQAARKAFPQARVFVAATNDTSERPFPFAVKEKLAKLAGVDPGHFVQVKSPFRAEEITSQFDPQRDRLIFVRSEKDADKPPQAGGIKKNGEPAYLQPLAGQKNIAPFAKHAYMAYLPTVEFGPGMTSATEIRSAWPQLDDRRKTALVMSLYPAAQKNPALAANVVKLLDTAIVSESVNPMTANTAGSGAGMTATWQDRYNQPPMENQGWAATYEDDNADYIEEKWSQKYKSSINCANPRGFSQRAHCAGRKK
jgi:cytidyltransferase-like protein